MQNKVIKYLHVRSDPYFFVSCTLVFELFSLSVLRQWHPDILRISPHHSHMVQTKSQGCCHQLVQAVVEFQVFLVHPLQENHLDQSELEYQIYQYHQCQKLKLCRRVTAAIILLCVARVQTILLCMIRNLVVILPNAISTRMHSWER